MPERHWFRLAVAPPESGRPARAAAERGDSAPGESVLVGSTLGVSGASCRAPSDRTALP